MKLCFVDPPWAYFSELDPVDVTGDDFDDVPASSNAGPPYQDCLKVAYEGPFDCPHNSYSVDQLNRGLVPWLNQWTEPYAEIWAGTTYQEFCRLILEAGGTVYVPGTGTYADE